jgi:amiloride-sensitive sodium channel
MSTLFAVSFGGTASLFLGCSILSGVELLYYFTLRLVGILCTKYKEEHEIDSPPEVQQRLKERTSPGAVM